MEWYTWATESEFDTWHAAVITGLGMPWIGQNQATGEPQPDKQQTTAYTSCIEVAAGDWRARGAQPQTRHMVTLSLMSVEPDPSLTLRSSICAFIRRARARPARYKPHASHELAIQSIINNAC